MKSSPFNLQTIVLISVLSVILLYGVVSNLYSGHHIQIAEAKKVRHESKDTTDLAVSSLTQQQQQQLIPGAIQLSAVEEHSGYRWVNTTNGVINPTMSFNVGTAKTIQLQNPTDSKHQLVVDDANGNQLAKSGDIVSGSPSQLSFEPSMTGIFGYHCIYHPTTMRGIINVQ